MAGQITETKVGNVKVKVSLLHPVEGFEDKNHYRIETEGGENHDKIFAIREFLRQINDQIANAKPTDMHAEIWKKQNRIPDGGQPGELIPMSMGGITLEIARNKQKIDLEVMMKQAARAINNGPARNARSPYS